MSVNGKEIKGTEEEFFTGMMGVSMRVCGKMMRPMEKGGLSMQMEMCMRATGSIIKHRE